MEIPAARPAAFDPEVRLADLGRPLRWADLFGNERPVEVEVGFGKGRFLIAAGQRFPQVNYFGLERSRRLFRITQERVKKRDFRNVRIVRSDGLYVVREFVPTGSVRAYHVYFPDPWWKKRHRKRRIFTTELIGEMVRTLVPAGKLYVATDVEDYFAEIRALVEGSASFRPVDEPAERMAEAGYVPSNFEVKLVRAGRSIFRVVYQRV